MNGENNEVFNYSYNYFDFSRSEYKTQQKELIIKTPTYCEIGVLRV